MSHHRDLNSCSTENENGDPTTITPTNVESYHNRNICQNNHNRNFFYTISCSPSYKVCGDLWFMYFTFIWLLLHFKDWCRKRPITYLIRPDYPCIGLIKMRLLCPWIISLGRGNARVDNKRIYKCRNISLFFLQTTHSRPWFYIIKDSFLTKMSSQGRGVNSQTEAKTKFI